MKFITTDGLETKFEEYTVLRTLPLFQDDIDESTIIECPGTKEYLDICLSFFKLHAQIPWEWRRYDTPTQYGRLLPGIEGKRLDTVHPSKLYHETFGYLYSNEFMAEKNASWYLDMEGLFDWFGSCELNNFGNQIWAIVMYKYEVILGREDDCQLFRQYAERDRQYIMETELHHSKWYNMDGSDKTDIERERILEEPAKYAVDVLDLLSIMSNIQPNLLVPMRRERYERLLALSMEAMDIRSLRKARTKYRSG